MGVNDASFEFNDKSHVHEQKMDQGSRDHQGAMDAAHWTTLHSHDTDYAQQREQRIAAEAERLEQHYEALFNMPRPKNVPPPPLKTGDQIRDEAIQNVDDGHIRSRDEIVADHKIAKEDHVRETLDIPRKDNASQKERRAAYMKQLGQQRARELAQDFNPKR